MKKQTTWLKHELKTLTDTSPKKMIYRWKLSIWKDVSYHVSLRKCKCKFKNNEVATMAKIWNRHLQMLTVIRNNRNSHSLPVRVQNGTLTLEDGLPGFCKIKHTVPMQSNNYMSWYLPKGVENVCSHKNLYTYIYISFLDNCQNSEATTMFFSK